MNYKTDQEMNNRPHLVSLKIAIRLVSASRSSIYRWIHAGSFPAPLIIGKRAIAFKISDIEKWIESRPRVQLNNKEDK